METKIRRRCECGCGSITKQGNKYILGHNSNQKGIKRSEITKRKMSIAKSGKNHPMYGKHHSKETKRKISLTNGGKRKIRRRCKCGCGRITNSGRVWINGHNAVVQDKHHSKETKRKISLTQLNRTEEMKKKISLSLSSSISKKWKESAYVRKQMKARNKTKQNKAELKLEKVLDRLFPNEYKFVGTGKVIINGKCPDFINVNGQKKLIELFGNYWHRNDNPQDRIDIFTPFGYQTLVIWEHELKKNRLNLRRKLMNFHNEYKNKNN